MEPFTAVALAKARAVFRAQPIVATIVGFLPLSEALAAFADACTTAGPMVDRERLTALLRIARDFHHRFYRRMSVERMATLLDASGQDLATLEAVFRLAGEFVFHTRRSRFFVNVDEVLAHRILDTGAPFETLLRLHTRRAFNWNPVVMALEWNDTHTARECLDDLRHAVDSWCTDHAEREFLERGGKYNRDAREAFDARYNSSAKIRHAIRNHARVYELADRLDRQDIPGQVYDEDIGFLIQRHIPGEPMSVDDVYARYWLPAWRREFRIWRKTRDDWVYLLKHAFRWMAVA